MFQTRVVDEIKTHVLCSITFFFQSCADYEIMWKNNVEQGDTEDNMAHAHCILAPKATDAHSQYVKFIAFPLQQWLQ